MLISVLSLVALVCALVGLIGMILKQGAPGWWLVVFTVAMLLAPCLVLYHDYYEVEHEEVPTIQSGCYKTE